MALTSVFYLLLVPGIFALKYKPFNKKPPEIWLDSYLTSDSVEVIPANLSFRNEPISQNEYISKNITDYVVSDEIVFVSFSCESTYPITWAFPFPEQVTALAHHAVTSTDSRISEFNSNLAMPLNKLYKTSISLYIGMDAKSFLSFNLTCQSVKKAKYKYQSSVHVYLDGSSRIENEQETIHVTIPSLDQPGQSTPPLLLPCRPARPDIVLSLDKQHVHYTGNSLENVTKEWIPLNIPKSYMNFDPKVGFEIQRKVLQDATGLYRCSMAADDSPDVEQLLYINVTEETTKASTERSFTPLSDLNGTAHVDVIWYNSNLDVGNILCCSEAQDDPPSLFVDFCDGSVQCEMLRNSFLANFQRMKGIGSAAFPSLTTGHLGNPGGVQNCTESWLYPVSALVVCQGKAVNYKEQFVTLFNPGFDSPIGTRREKMWDNLRNHTHPGQNMSLPASSQQLPLIIYQTTSFAAGAPPSSKMLIVLASLDRAKRTQREEVSLADNNMFETYYEYSRDELYEGETLAVLCFGIKYFYAEGSHLRVAWENGTQIVLTSHGLDMKGEKIPKISFSGHFEGFYADGYETIPVFGDSITVQRGMSLVECWMPLKLSSRWDRLTKWLEIKPSVSPQFDEPLEETLYLTLDKVGQISCSIAGGLPWPTLSIARDGKLINLWEATGNETIQATYEKHDDDDEAPNKIVLTFTKVTHDHQGVYKCLGQNVNSSVTRTIYVFVSEKPSIVLPVSLTVVALLSICFAGLTVQYCYKKRAASIAT